MIRVLAFSDVVLPEGSGGVERTFPELYGRLAARGAADIRLVALGGDGLPRRERQHGHIVERARRIPLERLTGAQVAFSLDAWRTAWRAYRAHRPHVIHAHTLFFSTSLVAAVLARTTGTPLIVTVHVGSLAALPQPYRGAVQLYERTIGRFILSSAARIICVSDDVRAYALALGAAPGRTVVVPNGVDLARFTPGAAEDRSRPVVLSVGRLIFNKGLQYLLPAAAQLRNEGLSFQLVIAGDGPLHRELERDAAALGLDDTVQFLGRRDDVDRLLRSADIFVRPSLSEGMSLAVLEAMAAGLAVVATDVSGSRQLIADGESGFIVPPADVDSLASALRRLILDPGLRRCFGERAHERATHYTWESVADATAEEVARVLAA